MDILVTLDRGYLGPLAVMLKSLAMAHRHQKLEVYVLNSSLLAEDYDHLLRRVDEPGLSLHDVKMEEKALEGAPITDRYPKEMYYRIFAAHYLPATLKKVLYLDPDLVVLRSLQPLWDMPLENHYFAAATHVSKVLEKINEVRLQSETSGPYINSGVMLMNLERLRQEQSKEEVYQYIEEHKAVLFLPDQDVISALYGDRILSIDPWLYNVTDRLMAMALQIDQTWVAKNSCVVHYCGRNKPWNEIYVGRLDIFYHYFAGLLQP